MQPQIIVRAGQASLVGVPHTLYARLDDIYSYSVPGSKYMTKVINKEWDGIVRLFRDGRFPSGLTYGMQNTLSTYGINTTIVDMRKPGPIIDMALPSESTPLRPYQYNIVNKAFHLKYSSIEVATGGGKTLIGAEFISRVQRKAIFITPTVEILSQTISRFEDWFKTPIGILGNGVCDYKDSPITVATWQTINNRIDDDDFRRSMESFDTLVIDECQHIGANQIKKVSMAIPAIYRLGMSGSLFREDNATMQITASTGPKIASVSYSELVDEGYLVPAEFTIIKTPANPRARYHNIDYDAAYDTFISNNDSRNRLIAREVEKLVNEGRRVLIFVSLIKHGSILRNILNRDDIKFVYGDSINRSELINSFINGNINALISTKILNEGFDMPPIDAIILAAPSKSLITLIQRIGRGLRPYKDKTNVKVIDIFDNEPYFQEHYRRRFNYYRSEKSWKIERIVNVDENYNEVQ